RVVSTSLGTGFAPGPRPEPRDQSRPPAGRPPWRAPGCPEPAATREPCQGPDSAILPRVRGDYASGNSRNPPGCASTRPGTRRALSPWRGGLQGLRQKQRRCFPPVPLGRSWFFLLLRFRGEEALELLQEAFAMGRHVLLVQFGQL